MAAGISTGSVFGSALGSATNSPFRAPTQLPRSHSRKSPPLAFEKTPNDALRPLISPPISLGQVNPFGGAMSPISSVDSPGSYQAVIDKQSSAIQALHTAFAAERDAWACERQQLYQRVANLEKLLRAQNGHSPARSPITSPSGSVTSPQSRAISSATARLPSIAETENLRPLSDRREHAPRSINIPTIETTVEEQRDGRHQSVDFSTDGQFDELFVSLPRSATKLSPFENTAMAGHTPLRSVNRPPTPPPKEMSLTEVEDTPTRNNTHINALLTQGSDEEEDVGLKGPLNMPELPSNPTANNFTEEMLVKRLEQIAQNPAENKPTIFSIPSPGLAVAEENGIDAGLSPQAGLIAVLTEAPLAPTVTRDPTAFATDATSPTNGIAQPASHDSDHDQKFAQGGIRLKKRPSTNFGAPFGQFVGFGSRKLS